MILDGLVDDVWYIFFGDPLSFLTTMLLGLEACWMAWGKHYVRAARELLAALRRLRRR